ncbi:MAG: hydrogen gas-evolving membrane-bound hydrogenase subunit E [Thermovirgaceae bacterium]
MKKNVLFLIALLVVTGTMWGALSGIHPFGDAGKAPMDDYYIENAQQERNVNNIVTSVVFDYRGFDTLGEAAVLFTAVCSVLVVFRKGGQD